MAYARFSPDSDVYVFPAVWDGIECFVCCVCDLQPDEKPDFRCQGAHKMLEHLQAHQDAGQQVTNQAITRLARVAAIGWKAEELEQMAREDAARAQYTELKVPVVGSSARWLRWCALARRNRRR